MPFVAAFVCNNHGNMRYKLLGGSSLSSDFMEIFRCHSCDYNCDLVYGYPYDEVCSTSNCKQYCRGGFYHYNAQGYCRNSSHLQFSYRPTGCPSQCSHWYTLSYIECGIEIP
ncbi:uncharacterized protein LOC134272675 [Saccostrea cucullata]